MTGVGRRRSIGAGLALGLADDGWDLVLNFWAPYDDRVSYARGEHDTEDVATECRRRGSTVQVVPADLAAVDVPARLVGAAAAAGGLRGLVMSHCESVDSSVLDTTVDSWDRHFAVNARTAWLLIKAFAEHLPAETTTEVTARIVALTSDHAVRICRMGRARARWTGSWWLRRSSWLAGASARTSSTRARLTPAG
ncbi:MAG: SDR family oxidoreductase [Streptosporangiaceae bacterium]